MGPERRQTARAPMANPLDARARSFPPAPPTTLEPSAAPLDESPEDCAARYKYVILPGGAYVEAHQAHAPRRPPCRARFDARWRPSDSPAEEAERQRLRAAECARVLGPRC